jgi:hypothetical protein
MAKSVKKTDSVIDRIGPIGFEGNEGIKINLYGRSGTGKTTLWATFPKPILAIICSGGKKSGELRSINTAEYRKTIKQVVIEKTDEIRELCDYQDREEKFATVVLDHATGLQDITLKEILGLDELPAQGSWGMAKQQDWGQCALQMKEMLRALLSLSSNVVIVAQEREFNNDTESELLMPFVGSALTPSVTGWLNPACDYICQTFIRQRTTVKSTKIGEKVIKTVEAIKGKVDYCLRTAPDSVFTTKFRMPRGTELPECIVDPNFDKIMELISQGV